MHRFIRRSAPLVGAFAIAFALIAPPAGAAPDDSEMNSAAADGVGVARISLLEGNVGVQRGDSSDSLRAAPNAPVLGGDYVTTGDGSRAEIQLDGYCEVRLSQGVQMRFTHLDSGGRSLQLAAGTLDVRLRGDTGPPLAVDTPSITVKPQESGSYRITVTPDGQTLLTVRAGDAQIVTPQGETDLQPGSTLVAQGGAAHPSMQSSAAVALDDFDRFNADRDRAHEPALADAQYVNPALGGVEDLAADGRWVTDGSYGHVWVPADVGPDWAPYRDGRWVWEEGYGWTWIADEPWGWAPYHYGSWYNSPNYGWCWYPPQPRVFVPWRPALVAFIGFGGMSGGFSLGFGGGFGQIGWVPLAPFEPYHPWWGNRYGDGYGGPTIVNNVTNITNITNITNVTVYKNVQYNAVTSVSSRRFLLGDFSHTVAVSAPQLGAAHVFRGALPLVPSAANLRFTRSSGAPAVAVRPALMEASFAGGRAVIRRTPFAAQRVALAAATHAALTPLQAAHAAPPQAALAAPGAADRAIHRSVPPALGRAASVGPQAPPGEARSADVPASRVIGGGTAWSRFYATRPAESASTRLTPGMQRSPARAPVIVDERVQSGASIDPLSGGAQRLSVPPGTDRSPIAAGRLRASFGNSIVPRSTPHAAGSEALRTSYAPATRYEPRAFEAYHPPAAPEPRRQAAFAAQPRGAAAAPRHVAGSAPQYAATSAPQHAGGAGEHAGVAASQSGAQARHLRSRSR